MKEVKVTLLRYLKSFKMIDTNLYLSVRASNHKAIGFYNKMGMRQVGKTSWGNNTMKGLIYYKDYKVDCLKHMSDLIIFHRNISRNLVLTKLGAKTKAFLS